LTPTEQARTRRILAVMVATAAVVSTVFFAVWWATWRASPPEEHPHRPAPHGGIIVAVGEGDHHYHAEAVAVRRGVLMVYTYGGDAATVQEVESQVLTAMVRPEGEKEAARIDLLPMPRQDDTLGSTSRFFATLPRSVRGNALAITVPEITIARRRFRLDFPPSTGAREDGPGDGDGDEERNLLLTPAGKYTEADIKANGGVTAEQKFAGFQAAHDEKPRRGDRVCPVTRLKARADCSWAVGGQSYQFCCAPCVEEFVRVAKGRPDEVKDATDYVYP
jgi:hypothetical protein